MTYVFLNPLIFKCNRPPPLPKIGDGLRGRRLHLGRAGAGAGGPAAVGAEVGERGLHLGAVAM